MSYPMSNTGKALVGAVALTLGALGAAQLAFGNDFTGGRQSFTVVTDNAVNRAVKSDRSPSVVGFASPTQTISVQLNGLTDTTVVVRIPLMQDVNSSSIPLLINSGRPQKHAVACEAMVSVLTDVAKQLPPGRCVT